MTIEIVLVLVVGVYDITSFVPEHPGSPESLLDHAGGDASLIFSEIGHSSLARGLKESFLLIKPRFTHNLQMAHLLEAKARSAREAQARGGDRGGPPSLTRDEEEPTRSGSVSSQSDSDSGPLSTIHFNYSVMDRFYSRLDARMEVERKAVCQHADKALRDVNVAAEFRICTLPNEDHIDCHNLEDEHRTHSVLHGGIVLTHNHRLHVGQPRVFYDPLVQEWCVWWSCCGWAVSVARDAVDSAVASL
jgi:hypothetical protein